VARDQEPKLRPWPLILTATLSIVVTAVAWQLVHRAESAHIRRMVKLAASAVRADLASDTESWIFGLVRLAKLWESPEGPSNAEWQSNAQLYIQHHPGCLGVEWIQPTFEERWLVRAPGEKESFRALSEIRPEFLKAAAAAAKPLLVPAQAKSDGTVQRIIIVPIYRSHRFEGFVIALIDVKRSYASMMADVASLGYDISVSEAGSEIYRQEGSSPRGREWGQIQELQVGGVTQQLVVWPKPEVLGEMRTELPQTILLLGGLLGLLLTLNVYFAQKARTKSETLERANQKLLTAIEEQRRAEAAYRSSQTRLTGILEISADAVITVDDKLDITLFNQGAEKMFGYRQQEILGKPLETLVPERFREIHASHISRFSSSGQQTLLMSQRHAIFGLRKDGTEFRMDASLAKLELEEGTFTTAIVRDITEQVRVQEELFRSHEELEQRVQERTAELRDLSARLVHLQDEERRRIARELHDGTTQTLIAVSVDLAAITKLLPGADSRVQEKLRALKELINQGINEIRTVSYLLHPPLLDELGLSSALRNYVEGFSRRSGIQVTLELPDLAALDRETELAVFRVVQESLTNIHRHSGSQTASILLRRRDGELTLEIADKGCGIAPEIVRGENGDVRTGVGISSMRERARQLGGRCEISSNGSGTSIKVVLPAAQLQSAS
jgi:PAS domain S-box-containing protein